MLHPQVLLFIFIFWICLCLYLIYRGIKVRRPGLWVTALLLLLAAIILAINTFEMYPSYVE